MKLQSSDFATTFLIALIFIQTCLTSGCSSTGSSNSIDNALKTPKRPKSASLANVYNRISSSNSSRKVQEEFVSRKWSRQLSFGRRA